MKFTREEEQKVNFEKVRLVLKEAHLRGIIRDGKYDGQCVSIIGLFVHHGFTTREIALFAGLSEPAIRKIVLETYNRVKIFISN